MKNVLSEVINGDYDNKVVWVCAYHYANYHHSKPTRHLPPTKVMVNEPNRWNNGRDLFKFNKNGEIAKKGFMTLLSNEAFYRGEDFEIYENIDEALISYKKLSVDAINGYNRFIAMEQKKLEEVIIRVDKNIDRLTKKHGK